MMHDLAHGHSPNQISCAPIEEAFVSALFKCDCAPGDFVPLGRLLVNHIENKWITFDFVPLDRLLVNHIENKWITFFSWMYRGPRLLFLIWTSVMQPQGIAPLQQAC
jgi:hypothetical protein